MKRVTAIVALLGLLMIGTGVFAQSGDGSASNDVWSVAGQFKDVSFTAFLIGVCFLLWREVQQLRSDLYEVLTRQADWNRAVTPLEGRALPVAKPPLSSFSSTRDQPPS